MLPPKIVEWTYQYLRDMECDLYLDRQQLKMYRQINSYYGYHKFPQCLVGTQLKLIWNNHEECQQFLENESKNKQIKEINFNTHITTTIFFSELSVHRQVCILKGTKSLPLHLSCYNHERICAFYISTIIQRITTKHKLNYKQQQTEGCTLKRTILEKNVQCYIT